MFTTKVTRGLLIVVVVVTVVAGVVAAAPADTVATVGPPTTATATATFANATATMSSLVGTANAALQMLGTAYAGTGVALTNSPVPPSATPTPTPSVTPTIAVSGGAGSSGSERACSNIVLGGYSGTIPATPSIPSENSAKICDRSRIAVVVSSSTRFGNRIGDVIEVDLSISTDPTIIIDFTSLNQGVLKLQGRSPLTLALQNPVTISAPRIVNGRNVFQIKVRVQNMLPAPVSFSLDLRYRVATEQAGWKVLTTPDFLLTYSATVDSGTELLSGDVSEAGVRRPWILNVLLLAAALLIGLPFANEVRIWLKRRLPNYVPSAREAAWRVLLPIVGHAERGFDAKDLRAIERALRTFLVQDYVDALAMTRQELAERMMSDTRCDSVIAILTVCDRALYSPDMRSVCIDGDESKQLVARLQTLIPRE
ncbi:MAG: hypothetical protein JST89_08910 [Cyanobacteria bacterium SZAS-4]|nr:hypothetical protein [Cyanobacteria bacterium SZAS-4]